MPLVVFDSVLEHAVRIERVLNQPMGHMLLVGESGAGKTVLSRFVAWTEGLSVFQVSRCLVDTASILSCEFLCTCSKWERVHVAIHGCCCGVAWHGHR